jgi:hypothetical protein
MKRCLALAGILLMGIVLTAACGSQSTSVPAMTFDDTLGCKGEMCFAVLVSPSADELSAKDLANGLHEEYHDRLFDTGRLTIILMDDKAAAQKWIDLYNASDYDWSKEEANIYKHWVATYTRNKNTGMNQVDILSRTASADLVQTFKF